PARQPPPNRSLLVTRNRGRELSRLAGGTRPARQPPPVSFPEMPPEQRLRLCAQPCPAGGGFKPPSAALAEDCCGERDGKGTREVSGGDQEDVALNAPVAGFAVDASLLDKAASKPGVTFWPGMSLADTRLLARWCPAWRR